MMSKWRVYNSYSNYCFNSKNNSFVNAVYKYYKQSNRR